MITFDLKVAQPTPATAPAPTPLLVKSSYALVSPPATAVPAAAAIAVNTTVKTDQVTSAAQVMTPVAAAISSSYLQPASCAATDLPGSWVYASGGTNSLVAVTTADSSLSRQVVGVIVGKSTQTGCTVAMGGLVAGVFMNLTPGATYFLGPNGACVTAPLTDIMTYVQRVGVATGPSTMLIVPAQAIYKRCFT